VVSLICWITPSIFLDGVDERNRQPLELDSLELRQQAVAEHLRGDPVRSEMKKTVRRFDMGGRWLEAPSAR
jgi:hypothetical protein